MTTLTSPGPYQDDRGNRIECGGPLGAGVEVVFDGVGNVLQVHPEAHLGKLKVVFWCNHGHCRIGGGSLEGDIRVGEDCSITIGDGISCTGPCYLSTAEGTSITIGGDCMLARGNEIRADDAHPIFDVHTGRRVNPSRSITIGEHVWLADRAVVLAGSDIGSGSVIGFGAIVKGRIPNNCVAAGVPARVIRTDCAWERSHLNLTKPFYKPDADAIERTTRYWKPTA